MFVDSNETHDGYKGPVELTRPHEIVDRLMEDDVSELIASGRATLAMIRPGIEASVKPELVQGSDPRDIIEQHIENLGVLVKFTFQFDDIAMHEFYTGQSQQVQMERPPERDLHLPSRWAEFVGIMTGGPVTAYILTSPQDNAIAAWRQQVGSWDIENQPDPTTLRGKFGIHNYNNLLHGSDSPEEVFRELGVIAACVQRTVELETSEQ